MARFIVNIPKIVVALLLVAAIINLLIGVFLRYVMIEVTDWLDVDPIRFTWVEEVGEMMLAWLTLIGAAIGVRERSHFTLHVLTHRFSARTQSLIERGHRDIEIEQGLERPEFQDEIDEPLENEFRDAAPEDHYPRGAFDGDALVARHAGLGNDRQPVAARAGDDHRRSKRADARPDQGVLRLEHAGNGLGHPRGGCASRRG